jgi:DNA-binding NtrC family response regulator
MAQAQSILYLEGNDDHADLVQGALAIKGMRTTVQRVTSLNEALAAIDASPPALCIASLFLGGQALGDELSLLRKQIGPSTPLLVLSRNDDADFAAAAMKRGANEYLVKNRAGLKRLPALVQRLLKSSGRGTRRKPPETAAQGALLPRLLHELEGLAAHAQPLASKAKGLLAEEVDGVITRLERLKDTLGR